MFKKLFAVAVGVMVAMGSVASMAATLKEPTPIPINPQRHPMQLLGVAIEAVKSSKYDWKIDESFLPAEVSGGYRIRVVREWNNRHVIYSYVTALPGSVSVTYADSRELDFKQGSNGDRRIHGSYNEFTQLLSGEIAAKIPTLCGDFTFLQSSKNASFLELSSDQPLVRMPRATEQIPNTSYVIREYTGFIPNGSPYNCGPIVAVFQNDKLVDVYGGTAALAKLNILGELISQRHASGKISYGQAAAEYKEAELGFSQALEGHRQKQLISFYRLLASRLSKKEISVEEFDYLAIEKEAELKDQQDAIRQKQTFEQGLVSAEREKAFAMQNQAAALQSQAQAQHQANFQSFLNSLKTVTCRTVGYGNSATTTCN
ncbi:MAG TPA: hypothetical protein VM469_10060 [Pseudoxanthomonas sp.]|jgi:hypothetical protein|nr:hypothetical protein [Pseudoxanthomonas sp.]